MKKMLIVAIAMLVGIIPLRAQEKHAFVPSQSQLDAVLLPIFGNDLQKLHNYPIEKQLVRYYFSYNSFYVSDELPKSNIPVYDLSVLTNNFTGVALSNDAQVNPATLSYYAYNFASLQIMNPGLQIAFRTPGCEHAYLILRTPTEANAVSIENNQYNP